jgi:hypothetical protein
LWQAGFEDEATRDQFAHAWPGGFTQLATGL